MENNKQAGWYYEIDGRQIGPVSEDEIKACVETSCLSYGDMVWLKGTGSWVKLEESELKFLLADRPPPLNNQESGETVCWFKKVILVIITVGVFINFCQACIYASGSEYLIARAVGRSYANDVTTADRCNAGIGYFITLGIAPEAGTRLVRKSSLWRAF